MLNEAYISIFISFTLALYLKAFMLQSHPFISVESVSFFIKRQKDIHLPH